MQQAVTSRGHVIAATPGEADANVLVTCTVIETTERTMLGRMKALAAEGKPLVVAGGTAAAPAALLRAAGPPGAPPPPRESPRGARLPGGGGRCAARPG